MNDKRSRKILWKTKRTLCSDCGQILQLIAETNLDGGRSHSGLFFISTTLRRHFQEMNREGRPTKGIVQQGGSSLRKRKKVCHRRPQALGDPVGLVQNLGGRQDGTLNPS
jgi:hypothetical protein